MKWQWGVQEVIGNSNREKREREKREGRKKGRVQTNELLSRYLPCGCTGLLEHKCILILQSLKLDVATRL